MVAGHHSEWIDPLGEPDPTLPSPSPGHSDHLLKVAQSVTHDATQVWTDLWSEFKDHISANGVVMPPLEKGFVPACGWKEFLEKFRLLKFHLDSVARVCKHK